MQTTYFNTYEQEYKPVPEKMLFLVCPSENSPSLFRWELPVGYAARSLTTGAPVSNLVQARERRREMESKYPEIRGHTRIASVPCLFSDPASWTTVE